MAMFPTWRFKLREARLAYNGGRYDEAGCLLQSDDVRDFLPAKQLASQVAAKFVQRADDRFMQGESSAGWNDLLTANRLGGQDDAILRIREQYAKRVVEEVRQYLTTGDYRVALDRLAKLQRRGLLGKPERDCRQLAMLLAEIEQASDRGHFAEAKAAAEKARLLAAQVDPADTMALRERLAERTETFARQEVECQRLAAELHAALSGENWSLALSLADAILAMSPQHTTAKQARRKAWHAVGMDATRAWQPDRRAGQRVSLNDRPEAGRLARRSTHSIKKSSESDTVAGFDPPRRLLLWVDAVGGYLLCLDDAVLLGQPTPEVPIAVPIFADLSRRHAVIRRDGSSYVLEPIHEVYLEGRRLHGPTVLGDRQLIQLGDSVRLRFTKPHALSATARLTLESHHKTQPSADAVLLMAESCVLGPNPHSHIHCPNWHQDVLLFRDGEELKCRTASPVSVDGEPATEAATIGGGSRIEGEDFSLSLEEIDPRL